MKYKFFWREIRSISLYNNLSLVKIIPENEYFGSILSANLFGPSRLKIFLKDPMTMITIIHNFGWQHQLSRQQVILRKYYFVRKTIRLENFLTMKIMNLKKKVYWINGPVGKWVGRQGLRKPLHPTNVLSQRKLIVEWKDFKIIPTKMSLNCIM